MLITTSTESHLIKSEEVSHISSEGDRYCWIVMISGKRKLLQMTISEILCQLPSPPFFQVHEDHIVQIEKIKKIASGKMMQLELLSGQILPISKKLIHVLIK